MTKKTQQDHLDETAGGKSNALKIQELNDNFRRTLIGGNVLMTLGIQELARGKTPELIAAISTFNNFTQDNDPYNEHDFGTITFNAHEVFWKIDYYDKALVYHSPDAADPTVTVRVMTIMLAEEY